MNLVDCHVTKILSEPYYEYGFWWLKVRYDSYGVESETAIMRKENSDLENIEIGFEFTL